jgi:hypothetical protein
MKKAMMTLAGLLLFGATLVLPALAVEKCCPDSPCCKGGQAECCKK